MKLLIDIPQETYDAIMARDWKNAGWLFSKELKAIHDGKVVEAEQRTGHWIFHESFDNGHKNCNECIECSQCHIWLGHDCYAKTPYCPNCGAKMKEGD